MYIENFKKYLQNDNEDSSKDFNFTEAGPKI
jgi:hypothetical protein